MLLRSLYSADTNTLRVARTYLLTRLCFRIAFSNVHNRLVQSISFPNLSAKFSSQFIVVKLKTIQTIRRKVVLDRSTRIAFSFLFGLLPPYQFRLISIIFRFSITFTSQKIYFDVVSLSLSLPPTLASLPNLSVRIGSSLVCAISHLFLPARHEEGTKRGPSCSPNSLKIKIVSFSELICEY